MPGPTLLVFQWYRRCVVGKLTLLLLLEESLKGDEESQHLFLIALRNVAEAQGGVAVLAKKAHVGRESLYKTLSGTGNPKWHTLVSLCVEMGLNLRLS